MKDATQIIVRPLLTEKNTFVTRHNQFVFEVAPDANKIEIRSAVEDPINRLVEGMRGMHEVIDIIALVGGHPERYRDVLTRRFPAIPVFIMPEPMSANVRGFQLIGEALAEG